MSYAKIILIGGPMFAGKTTCLINILKEYESPEKKVRALAIKFRGDTRYSSDLMCTHDKATHSATSVGDLSEIKEEALEEADVIVIDEGQFFPDLREWCLEFSSKGKTVIVGALISDFMGNMFEEIRKFIPICDETKMLTARCECGRDATMTKRKSGEGELIVIGGADKYEAVCKMCFFKK